MSRQQKMHLSCRRTAVKSLPDGLRWFRHNVSANWREPSVGKFLFAACVSWKVPRSFSRNALASGFGREIKGTGAYALRLIVSPKAIHLIEGGPIQLNTLKFLDFTF